MRFFVTGCAGFIGFHLAARLLRDGHQLVGYDAVTDYYDPSLKRARLAELAKYPRFTCIEALLEARDTLQRALEDAEPDVIVHLAAQAGVRYSVTNPQAYASANLIGTFNLIDVARHVRPKHLLVASTSSVYGGNQAVPFREVDLADWPVSFYAATKKAGEAMTHAYAHLHNLPTTCFRFFTVYGPWGRPDMALFKFVDAIERDEPIEIYGGGQMRRDFTYVDDLIEAIVRLEATPPTRGKPIEAPQGIDSLSPVAPWRVVNIGGGEPVALMDFVATVEAALGKKARCTVLPMQQGDVAETWASPDLLRALTGYVPSTPLAEGVRQFVSWRRAWSRSRLLPVS